jgi:adenylate cyclase, class 2
MPIEVELKARLTDPDITVGRLRERAGGETSTYQDTYYDWPDRRLEEAGRQELRLRIIETDTDARCVWTFKGAMLDAASTPEYETAVADAEAARAILTALGLEPIISYTKLCENFRFSFNGSQIVATVVRVPEIEGVYLETETLVPDSEDTSAARDTILGLLTELGLSEGDLEPTFYIDLVRADRLASGEGVIEGSQTPDPMRRQDRA